MNTSTKSFWLTVGGALLFALVPASLNTFIPAAFHLLH